MNDEIDTNEIRENLKQQDVWVRLLFIIIFSAILSLTSIVLTFVVVIQFLSVLFTRAAQENLLDFGSRLADYVRQVIAYLTFNSEFKPFPFGDWPGSEDRGTTKKTTRKKNTAKKKTSPDSDGGATTQ